MKTLISSLAMVATASVVNAADLAVDVDIDITENTAGKYTAAKKVALDVTAVGDAFGSVEVVAGSDNSLSMGDWHVGTALGATSVSFGKQ